MALSKNNNRIKGKKQLAGLCELIKYMSNKFDEFEKERQEQEKEIKELRSEICFFNEKCNCIMELEDQQEQYSRQNWFLIHSMELQESQENTDALDLEIFKEKLDIKLIQKDLDQTDWIDKDDKKSNRSRPVMKKVFAKKKQLKITGI